MKVTSSEIAIVGNKRGRICVRPDGYFQAVTETYREPCDEHYGYWINDYPPSGILGSRDEAISWLQASLAQSIQFRATEPCEIDVRVGPWPDPVIDWD